MISYRIGNFFNTLIGRYKQMLRTFETDLLDISGIGKSGLPFDQTVEIILLIMELIHQILDRDIFKMRPDIIRDLFEYDPVHGLLLLLGKRKIILRTQDPEDPE